MFNQLDGWITQGVTLTIAAISLVAAVMVIRTFWRTGGQLGPLLGAVFVAGIAVWAVGFGGVETVSGWVGQDAGGAPAAGNGAGGN